MKVVQVRLTDSEARGGLIESLTFENTKLECKNILGFERSDEHLQMNGSCIQ